MDSGTELKLPKMKMIRQRFDIPPAVDVLAEVDKEWMNIKDHLDLPSGSSVAMAVGSRGISNLSVVVRAVATKLKEAGYDPFVTPAMAPRFIKPLESARLPVVHQDNRPPVLI